MTAKTSAFAAENAATPPFCNDLAQYPSRQATAIWHCLWVRRPFCSNKKRAYEYARFFIVSVQSHRRMYAASRETQTKPKKRSRRRIGRIFIIPLAFISKLLPEKTAHFRKSVFTVERAKRFSVCGRKTPPHMTAKTNTNLYQPLTAPTETPLMSTF